MGDPEVKERHSRKRKLNITKRKEHENKGAFAISGTKPKGPYKRKRIDIRNINDEE